MKLPYPVIFVPGITATYLKDLYPLPSEFVWKVMPDSKMFERVSLHPDNLNYEAHEPAMVRPDQVYEIAYRELNDLNDRWDDKNATAQERRLTGDGTVPFEEAVPSFIPENRLVLISPDDFEFWELQDKATTKLGGFHGILPNMNMLQRMLVKYIRGEKDTYSNTWGRAAPGVGDWESGELFGLEEKG